MIGKKPLTITNIFDKVRQTIGDNMNYDEPRDRYEDEMTTEDDAMEQGLRIQTLDELEGVYIED